MRDMSRFLLPVVWIGWGLAYPLMSFTLEAVDLFSSRLIIVPLSGLVLLAVGALMSVVMIRVSASLHKQLGGEPAASLGGDETIERSDRALFDQLADLGLLHFPATDHLIEHELAVLRLVATQRFPQRLMVGG